MVSVMLMVLPVCCDSVSSFNSSVVAFSSSDELSKISFSSNFLSGKRFSWLLLFS